MDPYRNRPCSTYICILILTQKSIHRLIRFSSRVVLYLTSVSNPAKMTSNDPKFPPQTQQTQPGKEHVMEPLPQTINPDHKPTNKLRVGTNPYITFSSFKEKS